MQKIVILGGTGFVGRHLVPRLARDGHNCRVLTRRPHRHRELLATRGVELREIANLDQITLEENFAGCDAVINLIGILHPERGKAGFKRLHIDLVGTLLNAAVAKRVPRYLHMSALNADPGKGSSRYLRSRGEGENRAHTGGKPHVAVTSFRPSVIFGPDDGFINRFVDLMRIPGPLPLACPKALFQPVYVEDVAEAFARALTDRATFGKRFDLCGPRVLSLHELVDYIAQHSGMNKWIMNMPDWASRLQASLLQFAPGKPFTPDNYNSMRTPSICTGESGLAQLGIAATDLDAVVPHFLHARSGFGQLDRLRRERAGRW